ncbi:uncharacterized protein C4orf19 homolog [Eumetopias jubatus]|uniref:uncharacterized protein C4orf19 homolog n=1 Tax=Eumetopias jubatus TaxID=34886 RepID=UPI001016A5AA|nr:uncharacterized protein C4orf19 homolog [Eumetopias jubatus]
MGCRCCKMIQSYLFDPVQVPSPGYVNEVNSCKVDEGDVGKLKGKQSGQVLVHKNELQSEGLKRTASRGRACGGQEPHWPPPGPPPQGDTAGGYCADRAGSAINGIGPAPLQPTGDHGPHRGDRGSCVRTAHSVAPTQPFPEGGGPGQQDSVLPASQETQLIRNGDSRASSRAEGPALRVQDHDLQIPAPDYPPFRGSTVDKADQEEKHCLSKSQTDEEAPAGISPRVGEHGLNMPFPLKRSWDSLSEAVATEGLSVYFEAEDAAQAAPLVDSRTSWEDAPGSAGEPGRDAEDEDAAVAEALAALEAATAGEDVDEAD